MKLEFEVASLTFGRHLWLQMLPFGISIIYISFPKLSENCLSVQIWKSNQNEKRNISITSRLNDSTDIRNVIHHNIRRELFSNPKLT